jgi:hypothetical protein
VLGCDIVKKRLVFPIFNGLVCAILGALIGYYTARIAVSVLIGGMAGLIIALLFEWALSRLGMTRWLYQRRVPLVVVLEIPIY